MRMDAGGNGRCGHCLEHRVAWGHAEQAARTQAARVDLEVADVARKLYAGPDDAQWKSEESAQKLGDREISGAARDQTLITRYDRESLTKEVE